MLKALSRKSIIDNGQQLTEEMRKDPSCAELYGLYIDETRKYREQRGENV